jgi:hypothetical protein
MTLKNFLSGATAPKPLVRGRSGDASGDVHVRCYVTGQSLRWNAACDAGWRWAYRADATPCTVRFSPTALEHPAFDGGEA